MMKIPFLEGHLGGVSGNNKRDIGRVEGVTNGIAREGEVSLRKVDNDCFT